MTTLAPAAPAAQPVTRARFVMAVVALATGGFAIGTTEFVTMGLLPQIAGGIGVTIPQAGHLISAYALGVVVGAPTLAALGARLPRRALLVWLMVAYAVLNLLSAAVSHYGLLAFVRFLDGLPHGAYFGVSALVASSMVSPERRGRALALVMMGIPVANLAGVPAATLLGQAYGWRAAYVAVGLVSVLTVVMILLFVPSTPGDATATGRRELAALRHPQLWYAVGAGAIGFGGLFALVSYIAPITTDVGGLPESAVAVFLLVLGAGMVVGNVVAGRLVDWSVEKSLRGAAVGLALALVLYFVLAPTGWWAVLAGFLVTVIGSVLALGFMARLMDAAEHAQTLGAAMSHASLNIGNALGAWLGGLVIAAGYGLRAPLVVGAALALAGLGVLVVARRAHLLED
ncbi:putative permease of the major facilitator superfamily protein [Nocardioides sp. OK12]|uniref:MFS transporter n=1 Tax=Nocardioides sp. OK12 TaxID=2758661 RepID=UPI0021C429FF|nr:MFS transporter [Nocardioides sp. OK12]GHJ61314.1 putative permease of the major facilitator superfamily protein [Nocardioides sp. OK12]